MIPFLFALAAVQAPAASTPDAARGQSCAALVASAPEKAVADASDWQVKGGGLSARQCLGLAYSALGRWAPAATAFEAGAREAETRRDPRLADFWVKAGNAWLADNQPARARTAFDAALATASLTTAMRGEVHLDRGRAGVALGDLPRARADIDRGLELVPADPFAWFLSSALAMREKNLTRAQNDIAKAMQLAPDDADVLLQAGTVAGVSGEVEAAKVFYARAAKAAPNSEAGRAAQQALAGGEQAR